jgi:hypothetical protein
MRNNKNPIYFILVQAFIISLLSPSAGPGQPRNQGVSGPHKKLPKPVIASAILVKNSKNGCPCINLTLCIRKGWMMYANPVGLKDLEDLATRVAVIGKGKKVLSAVVDYPRGAVMKDALVGSWLAYKGKVVFPIRLNKKQQWNDCLNVKITFNARNATFCGPPETVQVKVMPQAKKKVH